MTPEELAAIVEGIAPAVRDYVAAAVADVSARVTTAAARLDGVAGVVADVGAMRERVAVLETRAPVPGPMGPAGVDGVGFEDLTIEQREDTTIAVLAKRGDVVKVVGSVTFPVVTFVGDFEPGRSYTPGNVVRAKSALWHCKRATTLAPDSATAAGPQAKDFWTLLLRDGKRGADGKDGAPGPAGKTGKDWQQVYDDTRGR